MSFVTLGMKVKWTPAEKEDFESASMHTYAHTYKYTHATPHLMSLFLRAIHTDALPSFILPAAKTKQSHRIQA